MPFFATLDNTKLYYEDTGSGQPIVFIHGLTCSHDSYTDIVSTMKEQYRSDTPEGGYTIAQLARDLKELMDYLELKDVILVGHSMGGFTIYDYISQFGCDNLNRVAILDMSPMVICDDQWRFGAFGSYDAKELAEDMEMMGQSLPLFLWKFLRNAIPAMSGLPESMRDLIAPSLKGFNHTLPLLSLWHSMFTRDYRGVAPAITVPTAYVCPEHGLYPRGAAEYLSEHATGPVTIIDAVGCSHMSPVEQPAKTAQDLIAFINS